MSSAPKFASILLLASLCLPGLSLTAVAQRAGVRKPAARKKTQADPPPYTPGPLDPLPLDQMPTVAPVVTYEDGHLTIVAHNCTLADVLRAIRKQTGAELDIPPGASERVVADLGPGSPREVIADLLNGTHFNYVMVGSAADPTAVQSIALIPKSGGPESVAATPPARPGFPQGVFQSRAALAPVPGVPPTIAQQDAEDNSADAADDADQADAQDEAQAQPDQQALPDPNQQTPKTPEQLLQELQRQQQQQQQSQPQQPPQPGQAPQGLFPNLPPTEQPNPRRPD